MSFLKLENEREKRSIEAEIERMEQIEAERESKSDNLAYFAFFVIVGMFVGFYTSTDRDASMKISTMIGTATALFLFSGIISLISIWLTGKWKLAFTITFFVLVGLAITSVVLK